MYYLKQNIMIKFWWCSPTCVEIFKSSYKPHTSLSLLNIRYLLPFLNQVNCLLEIMDWNNVHSLGETIYLHCFLY